MLVKYEVATYAAIYTLILRIHTVAIDLDLLKDYARLSHAYFLL